jgi:putative endonuclease
VADTSLFCQQRGVAVCAIHALRQTMVGVQFLGRMKIDLLERTLAGFAIVARMRSRADKLPAHLSVGIAGEDAVFFYLRRKGYTVVARRWSSGDVPGDVDLIAWQGSMLCFIEVKTRTAHDLTPAEIAVDEHKRKVLRRLARRYVQQLPQKTAPPVRFDVVSVYLVPGQESEFQHFEGSFGLDDNWRS